MAPRKKTTQVGLAISDHIRETMPLVKTLPDGTGQYIDTSHVKKAKSPVQPGYIRLYYEQDYEPLKVMSRLSYSGFLAREVLFYSLSLFYKENTDLVVLNNQIRRSYAEITGKEIQVATFYKGINELVKYGIIQKDDILPQGVYRVNFAFIAIGKYDQKKEKTWIEEKK